MGPPRVAANRDDSPAMLSETVSAREVIASTRASWALVVVTVVVTSPSSGTLWSATPAHEQPSLVQNLAQLDDRIGEQTHEQQQGRSRDKSRNLTGSHGVQTYLHRGPVVRRPCWL